jgi:hypothetical protein
MNSRYILLFAVAIAGGIPAAVAIEPSPGRPATEASRPNIGPTAVDARWRNYGAYLQHMIEAVQVQWERQLAESGRYPASGTKVTVKFVLNAQGKVAKIINVDSTPGEAGSRACTEGLTGGASYGKWTKEMKAVLGEQQEMTFKFYYP